MMNRTAIEPAIVHSVNMVNGSEGAENMVNGSEGAEKRVITRQELIKHRRLWLMVEEQHQVRDRAVVLHWYSPTDCVCASDTK